MSKKLELQIQVIVNIGHSLIEYRNKDRKDFIEHLKRQIDIVITHREFLQNMTDYNPNKNADEAYIYLENLLVDLEYYKDTKKKLQVFDIYENYKLYKIIGKNKSVEIFTQYEPYGTLIYQRLIHTFKHQISKYDIVNLVQEVLFSLKVDEEKIKTLIKTEFNLTIKRTEPKFKVIVTTDNFLSLPLKDLKKETYYKIFIDYKHIKKETITNKNVVHVYDIGNYSELEFWLMDKDHYWKNLRDDFYDKFS
jgi:hypothetical protein